MSRFWKLFTFVFLVTICMVLVIWWLIHHKKADVIVDFDDRRSTVTVPPMFFGSGGLGTTVSDSAGIANITSVNMLGNRIWASLNLIYANSDTPDYGLFDQQLARATSNGLDPIIIIYGTPPSLGASMCAMPSDIRKWSKMAAEVVKHIDQQRPGLRYEFWNEPDSGAFCPTGDPLQSYMTLYKTAVPVMKRAAPTAKFGGPALAAPASNTATWIPAFLGADNASNVDFVSLHIYITGSWMLPHMTWDDLYRQTQDASQGIAFYYRQFEQAVRKGHQPSAATTPIYVTEYNANYSYSANCCQNHPVYGPLWNMVAIYDFLNVANEGSLPPSGLMYFMSGDANGFFCLEGAPTDDPTPCHPPQNGHGYVTYPSLLAYELFTGSQYLDLERSGFSVVGHPTAPSGLLALGLYGPTADILILINPTATDMMGLKVRFDHLGMKPASGQQVSLHNNALTPTSLPPVASMKTDLPAYSAVALSLKSQ